MADLPTGTVTFLFTDIAGSTALWEQHPETARVALARHDALVEQIVAQHAGVVVRPRGEGDSRFAVFARATDAVAAAAALQQAFYAEPWPTPTPLRVRMALHTGEADLRDGDYYGTAVNRCARLRAVAHGGQTVLSQATCDLVREHPLAGIELRDLGEHRLKDLQYPEHIYQLVMADLPGDFPPLRTPDRHPHNLPAQTTPLIGREQEVAAVIALLRQESVRLVTLTGPGGTGKTRLSSQVAGELLDDFPDGVWFVDLAPIADPALVASMVAQVLGVKEMPGQEIVADLQAYLQGKRLLLLLDNFEHLGAAAPLVADLLKAAPRLKLLATSRVPLHLSGEHEFPVPPLALPDPRVIRTRELLAQYPAVALFIQRAQAVKPDLQVDDAAARAIAAICIRLDGLPLAIELAAARCKFLTPAALLTRLKATDTRRLALLTGGAWDLPARQQTLRNTIDWSYELLEPAEQLFFSRLAVFVGGCTVAAAEAVCAAPGDLPLDPFEALLSLVDKSLLRQEDAADGQPRFAMLETIHEYARERLRARGEIEQMQQFHAEYYLSLAQAAAAHLQGSDQRAWQKRLEAELGNFRAALDWSLRQQDATDADVERAMRLAGSLGWFWERKGFLSEGRRYLSQALARSERRQTPLVHPTAPVRALALAWTGEFAWRQGDLAHAQALASESLARFQDLADPSGQAFAHLVLGTITNDLGDYPRARAYFEASLALYRDVDDRAMAAWALYDLGQVARHQDDAKEATALLEESLRLFRETGNEAGIDAALGSLGWVLMQQGDYARAQALLEESLRRLRELGDRTGMVLPLGRLGWLEFERGNYREASRLLREGLVLAHELGRKQYIVAWIEGLAAVATAEGEAQRAARLFGAAAALRDTARIAVAPDARGRREQYLNAARAQLDAESFPTAWAEGQAMTLEQAIAYALEVPEA